MRKAYKKAICFFLMFIMLAGLLVAPPLKVNATVDPRQDIEVTLAVDTASNNLDLSGFSDMLKNRLMTGYSGVTEDKIHINTVNTTTNSSGINWYRFDHTNNSSLASNTITDKVTYYYDSFASNSNHQYQNYHISTSTNQIDFYGYGAPAYKDFLYSSNSNANNKVFQFSLDESNTAYHSGEGAGFLFNASYNAVSNGSGGYTRTLSAYVVLITGTETSNDTEYITLYRLNNIDVNLFTNETSSALDNLGATEDALGLHDVSKWGGKVALLKKVAKTAPSSGSVRYLKLATSPTAVSFYQFTDNTYSTIRDKWLNNFTLPTVYNSFGFGPIAAYRSHGCAADTQFTFNNITMSEDDSKTFTNIVKNTTWNYPDSFRVIANLDNDGVPDFGTSSDLSTILYYMMQNSAHYIGWGVNNTLSIGGYSTVKDQSDGFVARNTGKGGFINRSDASYDTLAEGVNQLASYIANNMGLLMAKPVINVQYDSSFSSNGQVTVSTSNATSLGNSISTYEWKTLDVGTNSWVSKGSSTTASLSFSSNSYNLVSLRVQDSVTGQWSDYGVAYISTDTNAPSVAMFTLDKTSFDPDTELPVITATNLSYHPAGEAVTNWEWTVENETLTAQTAMARTYTNDNVPSSLTFDFSGKPGGRYTINLRVKKGSSGTWSPYYSQNVTFLTAPGITISLSGSAGTTTATVNANVYATGGTAVTGRGIEYRIAGDSAFTRVYDSGTGPGAFFANLSSLSPGTPYEVRGFAINATGTAYDNDGVTFTTATQVPVVTGTALVGTAGTTSATVRANVTWAGESTVTARGIEYRSVTSSVYTAVYTAVYAQTGGTGIFTVNLTGLMQNTSYIARGFATNSVGTAYDNAGIGFSTGTQTLLQDADALSIIYAEGDSAEHVTRAVFLPSKGQSENTTVTWSSSDTSFITENGRVVKRPEPGGADTYVTLTATLKDDATGAETTKTFTVKVLKLTDQDAVRDAAKNLTIASAFTFAPGDTWEAITNEFLAVTVGDHGTAVSWVSDNDAIKLRNESSGVAASVTRPADNNKNTILTATITRGTASVTKTFLLIVQKVGVSKTATRQPTSRTVTAATYSSPTVQNFTIDRSVLDDNTKIDYVLLDASNIQALTDAMNPLGGESQNTVTVVMKQDSSDPAQQLAVEIPATAVAAMAERNAILEIKTDEGSIKLERNVLSQMAERGTDLFFRFVPVNDAAEKMQASISANSNSAVIQLVGNKKLEILGIPRKIETNYTNFDTKVILPLTGITIPTTETQAFLDSLRIFVEHSDNTTELLIPLSFVYENGSPTGVEFEINRFSRFQIIRANAVSRGRNGGSSGNNAITDSTSIGAGVTVDGTETDDVVSVSTTKNENGGNDTTITVINDKLSEAIKNGNAGGNVTISTTDTADKLGVKLNGTLLKALQDKKDTLVIGTPAVSWSIPADAVDIDSVYDALGKPSSMSDVEINITLSNLYGARYDKIKAAIKATGAEMLSGAFDFKIDLSCNTKSVEIGKLGQYVEMSIPMPKDIDSKKITTGVYVSSELDISHVPTKVTIVDGTYYAKINSLYSSGIHTVIWNQREFPDVANHWSKEATNDMGSRTVVSGVDAGIYEPDRVITRAEFAAILVKGLGLRPVSTSNPFTDVKSDAWYGEVVKTAAAFNLIKGYEDGTFGPDKTISREEAMAMTARAMNLVKLDTNVDKAEVSEQLKKFTDGGNIAEWASEYAAACIKSGIIEGSDGTIRPENSITRAEVAAIIRRVLKKAGKI